MTEVDSVDSPVRVCLVVNNLDVGGLEKVALNLIHLLRQAGHDPHLICIDGAGKMFEEAALPAEKVLVLKKQGRRLFGYSFDPAMMLRIARFAAACRVQILHAHNLAPLVYAGLAARMLWRRPRVVYSEHNQVYSASPAQRARLRHYIRLADEVIAVSADLHRELVQVVKAQTPVTVVHNGIDAASIATDTRADVRKSWGMEQNVVIGVAAVLSKQKGVTYLLRAACQVVAEIPNARFVVIGDGPLREELIRERDTLGLSDSVLFMGYRQDVRRLMAGLDIYVQPSLWEGLPIVLLEALAAARPIVTTNVGGNSEAVRHGVNGLVVPPSDADALASALLILARDDAERAEMGRRNCERFHDHFTSAAMLRGHLAVYRKALR